MLIMFITVDGEDLAKKILGRAQNDINTEGG